MEPKRPKVAFPFKKIEKLIKLARDNQLEFLEVDGIKIIPKRQAALDGLNDTSPRINGRDFKDLSAREKEDYILFGPAGVEKDIQ